MTGAPRGAPMLLRENEWGKTRMPCGMRVFTQLWSGMLVFHSMPASSPSILRSRGPRFWLIASLVFGLAITITFRWAALMYWAIVVRTMDRPWWLELAYLAILVAIPLLVALLAAMLFEFALDRLGLPDRSRLHLLHIVPAAVLALLPLYLVVATISRSYEPPERPLVDSDSSGFCAPIEFVPGDSLILIVSIRSARPVDSGVRLMAKDQEAREFVAEGRQQLTEGVTRIRLSLRPEGSDHSIAWPLCIVHAVAWIPTGDGYEHVIDARSGSLAFIYPDRLVTPAPPAAPTTTPTRP